MKKNVILPANKGYALLLCCVIVGAAVYVPKGLKEYQVLSEYEEAKRLVPRGDGKTTLQGRPIVEKDDKTLVWALGDPRSDSAMWFDMTEASIDPRKFDHGLGADAIPSIDKPAFMSKGDPEFDEKDEDDSSQKVIGVFAEGEARAYPISIMNRHELVNDAFGDTHLTVAW